MSGKPTSDFKAGTMKGTIDQVEDRGSDFQLTYNGGSLLWIQKHELSDEYAKVVAGAKSKEIEVGLTGLATVNTVIIAGRQVLDRKLLAQ